MARLNIAPTKSNLLMMKEQLAVSTNGYELLEEKRVNIGGMSFPTIDVLMPHKELFYSFIGTDANMDATINAFFELLLLLTQMASIRTIVWRLAEEVRKTQRRVNALDKMIIPQAKETKAYIESALEERDRENIFVLKALKKKNGAK